MMIVIEASEAIASAAKGVTTGELWAFHIRTECHDYFKPLVSRAVDCALAAFNTDRSKCASFSETVLHDKGCW